jgi:anti-sigma B factor antagonist
VAEERFQLPGDFGVRVLDGDEGPVVLLRGELDVFTSEKVRPILDDIIDRCSTDAVVVLDMSDLRFLDSTGLGLLVGSLKRLRAIDGELELRAPQERVRKIFEIAGLDRLFRITEIGA